MNEEKYPFWGQLLVKLFADVTTDYEIPLVHLNNWLTQAGDQLNNFHVIVLIVF